jgi:2,3,4,5-tetrahydropyridine-2-carboxylate N-succinyltransferase
MSTFAFAFGLASTNSRGDILDVYYPAPLHNPADGPVSDFASLLGQTGGNAFHRLDDGRLDAALRLWPDGEQHHVIRTLLGSRQLRLATILGQDAPPASTAEAYLKLHLLSHRLVRPNTVNLQGIFAVLPNVAWTDRGAVDPAEVGELQLQARARGQTLEVSSVDKFPKMTNYVVPAGVRIAHTARVRLGAYIGTGTTVMHEGFVNFNAGTLGEGMIEGRISQGVTVGNGSDLGGSASIPGTLSGGGTTVISIGENCLISANAGCGICLGDRCVVEAGLYVTPGTLVHVMNERLEPVRTAKARELSGQSDMLFIRNSTTGAVECRVNRKKVALNEALHAHN